MANEITERIRASLRIEDVIGRTVKLRKTRRGFSGSCPFHDDRLPSFHVYTDTQHYYCFGCHEAGDIFTFVMKTQNLTFPEAVSVLADEAGIKVDANSEHGKNLYDIMKLAQEYFTSCLARLPAGKNYLASRGIAPEIASRYGLGYAPEAWNDLMDFLRRRRVDDGMMIDAGLVIQGERGMYDRFRGRVIFPVRDIAGRIIAFGGRDIVGGTVAKYINSPESSIYHKRNNLYMLDAAGSAIREKGYSILCEGYMDVLRLHIAGFRESVASLGTSLTPEQAGLLKRFADRCYICYDGDKAGQDAAIRGMYILAENGLDVHVIRIPNGQDPDDYLRSNPPESFRRLIVSALPLLLYQIEILKPDIASPLRRKNALRQLWECVKRLGPDESLQYLASLSSAFMLPPDEIRRRILGDRQQSSQPPAQLPQSATIDNGLECAFCAMLMKSCEARLSINPADIPGLLQDDNARDVAYSILNNGPDGLMDMWHSIGETGKISVITRGEIFLSEIRGLDEREQCERIHAGLEALRLKRRLREIYAKMTVNAATNDEVIEYVDLQRKLQGLRI